MADLHSLHCQPVKKSAAPLSQWEIEALLPQIPLWRVVSSLHDGKTMPTLQRTCAFKDFRVAMAFLRQVEEVAETEQHHPDFCVHYNKVVFTIWTHVIGGLHQNDFVLAAKIDQLTTSDS